MDGDTTTASSSDTWADTGSGLGKCGVPISMATGGSRRVGTGDFRLLMVTTEPGWAPTLIVLPEGIPMAPLPVLPVPSDERDLYREPVVTVT